MVRFEAEVDKINPYEIIREALGPEKRETTFSTFYGAVSIREWDGITLARRASYDYSKGRYVLIDEVNIDEKKYPDVVKKLRQKGLKEVL
jgi:lipopolysaccharide assembly outer membrane protein LptD (OstA)